MTPRPRRAPLTETLYGPGQATIASLTLARATLRTAEARLLQDLDHAPPDLASEALNTIRAARQLTAGVERTLRLLLP